MIRLRISPDGPLLLADGRRAVVEEIVSGDLIQLHEDYESPEPMFEHADQWQPIPITEDAPREKGDE